jgi:hypothetical protein
MGVGGSLETAALICECFGEWHTQKLTVCLLEQVRRCPNEGRWVRKETVRILHIGAVVAEGPQVPGRCPLS